MFGIYRFLLAILVVFSHCFGATLVGWYAVHGFFILSGFLMTLVLQETYGYSAKGIAHFGLNRVLRLYPIYWAILFIAIGLILITGVDVSSAFNSQMTLPQNLGNWVANITFIYPVFFPAEYSVQLSPPSYTLTIELLFYVAMGLGLSRTKTLCWIWFLTSVIYVSVTHALSLSIFWRYSMLAAGSLPFSLGSLLYHYRKDLIVGSALFASETARSWIIIILSLNMVFALAFSGSPEGLLFNLTFYINLALNGLLIINLYARDTTIKVVSKTGLFAKLDKMLGDLSYPVYLIHVPFIMAVSVIMIERSGLKEGQAAIALFALVLSLSILTSVLLVLIIDRPIQHIRAKLRPIK